jgi:predicted molibdopterin-dependent oxidoreductase YjgC
VKRDHGGDAFAAWASARTTSESNYLLMKMARGVMGTNNVDNCQRT